MTRMSWTRALGLSMGLLMVQAEAAQFNSPGLECRGSGSILYADTRITNVGTGTSSVWCPISQSSDSAGIARWYAQVYDASTSANVQCRLAHHAIGTSTTDYGPVTNAFTNTSSTGNTTMDLGTFNTATQKQVSVFCLLPPNSSVYGVRWDK